MLLVCGANLLTPTRGVADNMGICLFELYLILTTSLNEEFTTHENDEYAHIL